MKILKASQMAEVDRLSTEVYHIPSLVLMENAGRFVAEEILKACPDLPARRIYVFCGKGNNGGDGFVAARHLALREGRPEVFLFGDPEKLKGDALVNWEIVRSLDLPVHVLSSAAPVLKRLEPPDVVVDALFGTGLSKPIGADFRRPVERINAWGKKCLVVSVDIPSGLFSDSAEVPGPAVKADVTVTFTALKPAQVLPPAADHAGRVVVVPIGSPAPLLENADYRMELIDAAQVGRALPPRPRDSHKGHFGHVFVVAGSRGKSGAALMTGLAALRSGAGLVTLWLPESLQKHVIGKVPELMAEPIPDTPQGTSDAAGAEKILGQSSQANVLAIGPGMTTHPSTRTLIQELVRRSPVPVVLDADGINAFAGEVELLRNENGQPVVITPHPGEMARLLGSTISDVQNDRLGVSSRFSQSQKVFSVLKGFQTVVTTPAGLIFINSTGNPGMAKGGSGDILSGIMARFVGSWQRRFRGGDLRALADHVSAAVYLHGLAGDLATEEKGTESMIATDLLPHLPEAFKTVLRG